MDVNITMTMINGIIALITLIVSYFIKKDQDKSSVKFEEQTKQIGSATKVLSDENRDISNKVEELHKEVNGRMTDLIESTKKVSENIGKEKEEAKNKEDNDKKDSK